MTLDMIQAMIRAEIPGISMEDARKVAVLDDWFKAREQGVSRRAFADTIGRNESTIRGWEDNEKLMNYLHQFQERTKPKSVVQQQNPEVANDESLKNSDVSRYVENLVASGYMTREEAEKFAMDHPDLAQNWLSKYQYSSKDDSKVTIVNNAVNENISKMGSSQLTQSLVGDETEKLDKSELPTQEIKRNIDLSDLPEINITEQPHNIEPITSDESTFKPAVEERPTAVKLKGVKKAKSALIQKWKNLSRKQKIAVIVGTAVLGTVAIGSAIYAALTGDNSAAIHASQLDSATVTHAVDQANQTLSGFDVGQGTTNPFDYLKDATGLSAPAAETTQAVTDAANSVDTNVFSEGIYPDAWSSHNGINGEVASQWAQDNPIGAVDVNNGMQIDRNQFSSDTEFYQHLQNMPGAQQVAYGSLEGQAQGLDMAHVNNQVSGYGGRSF